MNEQFDAAARSFDVDGQIKKEMEEARRLLEQFLKKFPFRQNPSAIDELKPENLFEKGNPDSFFQWLEYKLKDCGRLFIGSRFVFDSAVERIDDFKDLLRIAVDDSKEIHEKIDAPWEKIKFFGGDKHIAKKIIYCYYSDKVVPIFKTEEIEHFCEAVGIDETEIKNESLARFGRDYENLSVGEKWQILNVLLLNFKSKKLKDWNNIYFMHFLYKTFRGGIPSRASEAGISKQIIPLNKWGLLFAPRCHEEVLYMFSVLHKDIGFPYIVQIGVGYPDVTAINDKGETKKIEIELLASQFDHDPKGCDYIVCWENDFEEKPMNYPEIIALRDYL